MDTHYLLEKSEAGETLKKQELHYLLELPPTHKESYQVMARANALSRELTQGQAEIHAQFALNLARCPCDCLFCSFAEVNNVFQEDKKLSTHDAVTYAQEFEQNGANAIFVMTTAKYDFGKFIEISQEIKKNLRGTTTMIANVGDITLDRAKQLKTAGYEGVYHALRLREGTDTSLSPKKREQSIFTFKEAGLVVGTCVEPIGPEHTNNEIAEMIEFTASFDPAYSGAARRIPIPNTQLAKHGMISELRMAQIAAITRLGMPRTVLGNCIHEPCTIGAASGATLFWAERGANPRDTNAQTEKSRGDSTAECTSFFNEGGWDVWQGKSRYYDK